MLGFLLCVIASVTYVHAQDGEVIVPDDDSTQCISQMIQWCSGMVYPQQGVGLAVLSLTFQDASGYNRVFCSSDADGTNCTKNREPWFACTPDHDLLYKGQILTNASTNVDNEICDTADKAFNELFVQNLSYDNTTLKKEVQKGMEAFFEQMAAMEEQIEMIQKMLREIPALNGFWGDLNEGLLLPSADSITPVPSDKQNATDQSNQIERE